MINCAHCKEQLSAYLDGLMTAEEKKLIEEHLSTCGGCGLALLELKKTQETLRNLEEVEPPPWFTQKIMNRVREEAESKKGLFQRLFYPLHIKIPVEALATCLVVVLALFIYRNTEPEMKVFREPEGMTTASSQDQPQKQDEKTLSAPKKIEKKSDATPKEYQEPQKDKITSALPDTAGTGSLTKDTPLPAAPPSELQVAKKGFDEAKSRYEQKTTEVEALKKQESIVAQKPPAAPARRLKEESTLPSVGSTTMAAPEAKKTLPLSESKSVSIVERKKFLFSLSTNNLETAVTETEKLLKHFGAINITKAFRQPNTAAFGADLPGQKIKEFFNALKTVGSVKEKQTSENSQQGYVAVSIEITSNP